MESGKFCPVGAAGVLAPTVCHLHPVPVDATDSPLPDVGGFAAHQWSDRRAVRVRPRRHAEHVDERGVDVDVGGQRRALGSTTDAGPGHEQRNVAERLVLHDSRLTPDVLLAEIVPVVGADDDRGALPEPALGQCVEDPADPVVDHAQLGAVVGPYLPPLPLAQTPGGHRADVVGRPDQQLAVPVRVVPARPGLGRVERLVRIEFVHEEQERRVVRRALAQPASRGAHRPRAGEVLLGTEEGA